MSLDTIKRTRGHVSDHIPNEFAAQLNVRRAVGSYCLWDMSPESESRQIRLVIVGSNLICLCY
jgi:hypothetical protein